MNQPCFLTSEKEGMRETLNLCLLPAEITQVHRQTASRWSGRRIRQLADMFAIRCPRGKLLIYRGSLNKNDPYIRDCGKQ